MGRKSLTRRKVEGRSSRRALGRGLSALLRPRRPPGETTVRLRWVDGCLYAGAALLASLDFKQGAKDCWSWRSLVVPAHLRPTMRHRWKKRAAAERHCMAAVRKALTSRSPRRS